MIKKHLVEWELVGQTKVLTGNLSQCQLVHHKSHVSRTCTELGPPWWEARNSPHSHCDIYPLVNSQDLDIDGKVIMLSTRDLHEIRLEDIDQIHLAEDRD
jgi:hypothetical protein